MTHFLYNLQIKLPQNTPEITKTNLLSFEEEVHSAWSNFYLWSNLNPEVSNAAGPAKMPF